MKISQKSIKIALIIITILLLIAFPVFAVNAESNERNNIISAILGISTALMILTTLMYTGLSSYK